MGREWSEIRKDLKNPLKFSNEELNELFVEVLQISNISLDIEMLKKVLTPEQLSGLEEKLKDENGEKETLFGIRKNENDKYEIYSESPEKGKEESPALILLNPSELSNTGMFKIVKEAAEREMERLSNPANRLFKQVSNLPKQMKFDLILQAIEKCERSNRVTSNEIEGLKHLIGIDAKHDLTELFRLASILITEFTAEEVKAMSKMANIPSGNTYRVIEEDSELKFMSVNGLAMGEFNLEFSNDTPNAFIRILGNAFARQKKEYENPYEKNLDTTAMTCGRTLSYDDFIRLLNNTCDKVMQYQKGLFLLPKEYDLRKFQDKIGHLIDLPQQEVNKTLLEALWISQTPFSIDIGQQLAPAGKEKRFWDEASNKMVRDSLPNEFVISKITNPKNGNDVYGISFAHEGVDGVQLIAFEDHELGLNGDFIKRSSLEAMQNFTNNAEIRGDIILGDDRADLLNNSISSITRYLGMDQNRDDLIKKLMKIDVMSENEIKDLLAEILAMTEIKFTPKENRTPPYDTLFKDGDTYVVTKTTDGQYGFKTVKGQTEINENNNGNSQEVTIKETTEDDKVQLWGLDEMHLNKHFPLFISSMKQCLESEELHATKHLTAAGIKTVLSEGVRVFERYQEKNGLTHKDLQDAVEVFSRQPEVIEKATTARGNVMDLALTDKELSHDDE